MRFNSNFIYQDMKLEFLDMKEIPRYEIRKSFINFREKSHKNYK